MSTIHTPGTMISDVYLPAGTVISSLTGPEYIITGFVSAVNYSARQLGTDKDYKIRRDQRLKFVRFAPEELPAPEVEIFDIFDMGDIVKITKGSPSFVGLVGIVFKQNAKSLSLAIPGQQSVSASPTTVTKTTAADLADFMARAS